MSSYLSLFQYEHPNSRYCCPSPFLSLLLSPSFWSLFQWTILFGLEVDSFKRRASMKEAS